MGSISSAPITKKINFEDVQQSLQQGNVVLINTLEPHLQQCLIQGTVSVEEEVKRLNALLAEEPDGRIIIYGMNATDGRGVTKYEQLINLGFTQVFIYSGGLFEWLLLQDVYGGDMFPTTTPNGDILKYKGKATLRRQGLLQN